MTTPRVALVFAAIILVSVAVIPPALASDGDGEETIAPGEHLAGAVGAQAAELDTEVDERTFGQTIAAAATEGDTEALAAAIVDRVERNEAMVANLTDRLETLQAQYADGDLTTGEYFREVARLEVQRRSIERTSGEAATAAMGLPASVLESHDINVTAIGDLQARASDLGGTQVAEIARQIAGPHVGNASPLRPTASDRMLAQVQAQDDPAAAIDRAEHWLGHAERTVDRLDERAQRLNDTSRGPVGEVDEAVWRALDDAQAALDNATTSLAAAETALDDGDELAAIEHAVAAATHAMTASEHAAVATSSLHIGPGGPEGGPPDDTGPPGN